MAHGAKVQQTNGDFPRYTREIMIGSVNFSVVFIGRGTLVAYDRGN